MKLLLGLLCSTAVGLALLAAVPASTAGTPPAGCPSCHVAGKYRALDASLKTIKGHPALASPTVAVCVACHKKNGRAPEFYTVMHRRHLAGTAFGTTYKGTCASCHAVDIKTGQVTVIGLPAR